MELQTVIFYGKAGAGKGTQADLLRNYFKQNDPQRSVLYIETGAAFREFAKRDNFTAKRVKQTLDEGGLLPEFLPVWIWTNIFIDQVSGNEHIILDGLARREDEVPVLYRALEFYRRPHVHIVVLDISEEEVLRRLKGRGRSDDTEKEIRSRLMWYEKNVVPAIERWRGLPWVEIHTVSAAGSPEEEHARVLSALGYSPATLNIQ